MVFTVHVAFGVFRSAALSQQPRSQLALRTDAKPSRCWLVGNCRSGTLVGRRRASKTRFHSGFARHNLDFSEAESIEDGEPERCLIRMQEDDSKMTTTPYWWGVKAGGLICIVVVPASMLISIMLRPSKKSSQNDAR